MKKAETGYTARISSENARKARRAARMARRAARGLQNYAIMNANSDVFYLNVNGISAPICR